jgi:hypothetical protein
MAPQGQKHVDSWIKLFVQTYFIMRVVLGF